LNRLSRQIAVEIPPMPNCTVTEVPFAKLGRRSIDVRFDGGDVSSDGGLLLLRQVERRLGLLKGVAKALPDPRHPCLVQRSTEQLLRQRVFGLCQGYEDLNDHDRLRDDLALQTAVGKDQAAASSPTLCRFESRADRAAAIATQRILIEQFIASFKRAPEELVLDFDATDDLVHGQQEGRQFSAYYDNYVFLPLYVFCGEQLLVAYLRPAKQDAALHAAAILKLLVSRLRQAWPGVRIIFRGDCGFCRPLLLSWCERHHVHYVVGIGKNSRLLAQAEWWREQAARAFALDPAAATHLWRISLPRRHLAVPPPADRQSRAPRARRQSPLCGHQSARPTASALRNNVLRSRRNGEPDQGMSARPVC
jgi:Transposase DDE domain group 1